MENLNNLPPIRRISRPEQERLSAVFRRTMAMYVPGVPAEGLQPGAHLNAWDWGPGIALYGLQKTYRHLDPPTQQVYFRFWQDWFNHNLDKNPPTNAINGSILLTVLWQSAYDPGLPLSNWERDAYRAYCRRRAEFYLKNATRLPSGVFGHLVAGFPESGEQVWADNLFMLVLFLAQGAATNDNKNLFGEMVRQLELHYELLTDPSTGLLYHGWKDGEPDPHINGALWGRGNGWAAMGMAELLELCAAPGFETFRARILRVALPHFRALLSCQRSDGRWNTLLNQPSSYLETSATAAFAYAFLKASRLGALGPEYERAGRKALEALSSLISPGGEVAGVSGSTPLLPNLEAYSAIPAGGVTTWGQGIALLALGEGL